MAAAAAVTVMAGAGPEAFGAGPAPASAATWSGTAEGKLVRSNSLISGGTAWHGNFWFHTGAGGAVHGYAVMAYEPTVDVTGLNGALTYIKSYASAAAGLLGIFGTAVNTLGINQIVNVSVSFSSPFAVRRGPLTGSLQHGRLTLRWNGRLAPIPYGIDFRLVSATKQIGKGSAVLRSPFQSGGALVDSGDAVAVSQPKPSNSGGIKEVSGAYWVAHRTG